MADPRFLCDEHVPIAVHSAIAKSGIDVEHVLLLGLRSISDPSLLQKARDRDRILLTRNYGDFASLVALWTREEIRFPGVLFFSPSIRANDVGAHVRSVTNWLQGPAGVADTYGWLT